MKKKMLLVVGLLAFLGGVALPSQADTAFNVPTTPSFSSAKNPTVSKAPTSSSSTASSKSSTTSPSYPVNNGFVGGDLGDYSSSNSPSKVMNEVEKKKARENLDNYTSYMYFDDGKFLTGSMSAGMQTFFCSFSIFRHKNHLSVCECGQ